MNGAMPKTILLLQDNPSKAVIVQAMLAQSSDGPFVVEWIRSCAAGLDRLNAHANNDIAAILIDLLLPEGQELDTFDQIFQASPHIPILVLSDPEHEDVAKQAVQRGAQDYILDDRLDSYSLSKALHNMLERTANAEALFKEKERAQVTLNSIGDGVISTDVAGNVTYLNQVAEALTGWTGAEALGRPFSEVFRIIDRTNPVHTVDPMSIAMQQNKSVVLSGGCMLIRRDGNESAIEDSAAPIHDRRGQVTGAVMVFHDVSVARALAVRMSYLAQHDSLTDLPNRILLNDRITQAISLAHRHRQKLALLFLDVDRFKHVNDSLGHEVGDRLLQSVARRLHACVRSSDTLSRQGGDEFVILLSEIAHQLDAAVCADKILAALNTPHIIDQHELHLTASIGIAIYPEDGQDAQTLLKNADFAMYHAKDSGRSNYQFFRSDL